MDAKADALVAGPPPWFTGGAQYAVDVGTVVGEGARISIRAWGDPRYPAVLGPYRLVHS
jgi:hypothetical protein